MAIITRPSLNSLWPWPLETVRRSSILIRSSKPTTLAYHRLADYQPLLSKKGKMLITAWGGICLMSLVAKLFNLMILNRIHSRIDEILRKNQDGFRTGCNCIQHIHTLKRIMDGAHSQNILLFITFVYFKKAFDSIYRDMMFASIL